MFLPNPGSYKAMTGVSRISDTSSNLSTDGATSSAGRVAWLMATWLREGKKPPQAVLGIIEGYLHRVACPTYLGAISLYIGWSLERTEEMLTIMEDGGIVRPLTVDEKRSQGLRIDGNIWCLVERPTVSKARF
jgi:hypothetical protein